MTEQNGFFTDHFLPCGNFLDNTMKKSDALQRLQALFGHPLVLDTSSMELLMYYHHRHHLRDVYTIYLLYYNPTTDTFIEYTLYEHDCERQRRQPAWWRDLRTKWYPADKFFNHYNDLGGTKYEWPHHHTDRASASILSRYVPELRLAYYGEIVHCEL
jgi:hypothetical protein